jgi:hypothetical protein
VPKVRSRSSDRLSSKVLARTNAQKLFLIAARRRHREQGTAVKQAESHAEKIDAAFGQHRGALRLIPAEIHRTLYPQLYPQSRSVTGVWEVIAQAGI